MNQSPMNTQTAPSASDDAKTLQEYRLLAGQGHAFAQLALGIMYDQGQGVSQDVTEAAKWYRLAADQGNADAQFQLGMIYKKGRGVSQDDTEAAKWYRLAAEQGNADAQFHLGMMYRKGQGVPQDKSEAVKWYQLAAEQVNPKNPTNPHQDISTCRARLLGGTDLVECMMEVIGCQWAVPFGGGKFCKHPSAWQLVNSTQP